MLAHPRTSAADPRTSAAHPLHIRACVMSLTDAAQLKSGTAVIVPRSAVGNDTGQDVHTVIVEGVNHRFQSPSRVGRVSVRLSPHSSKKSFFHPHELRVPDARSARETVRVSPCAYGVATVLGQRLCRRPRASCLQGHRSL